MTGPQLPQQHDDPLGDARSQMVQALAVLTTVGEAAARWAAAGAQNRAQRAEQALRTQHMQDAGPTGPQPRRTPRPTRPPEH